METTKLPRKQIIKSIIAFGGFWMALLALMYPASQWRVSAHKPTVEAPASDVEVLHVPRDYATIQAAVNAASEGTMIQVAAGTYNENVVISKSGLRLHAAAGAVLDGTGLAGIGFHVLGTSTAAPVTDVEISGFEVENFNSGIVLQLGSQLLVHHNDVHDNSTKSPSPPLGDATGIDLRTTDHSEVSENFVHHNGARGIYLRVGSQNNMIRVNRVEDNGFQYANT